MWQRKEKQKGWKRKPCSLLLPLARFDQFEFETIKSHMNSIEVEAAVVLLDATEDILTGIFLVPLGILNLLILPTSGAVLVHSTLF